MSWIKWWTGLRSAAALLAGVVLVSSCGEAKLGGGISGTSMVVGSISGFGSVVVGGIAFDTSEATITIEGNAATEADLRLGMVASVIGRVSVGARRGIADRVAVENLLEGPIDSLDATSGDIGILGQTVVVDDTTFLDPSFAGLVPGEFITVAGFYDADGRIRATRVARPEGPAEVELRGEIGTLDAAAQEFTIGDLVVRYSTAVIDGGTKADLGPGVFVEVEGAGPPDHGGGSGPTTLTAVEVEIVDPSFDVDEGDGVSLEGFVTRVLGSDLFELNGTRRFRVSPDTRFEGGTAADLVPNARLEVEGVLGADGVLDASEVEIAGGAA